MKTLNAALVLVLCAALPVVACSDDRDTGPFGPAPVTPVTTLWRGLVLDAEDRCSPYSAADYVYSLGVE